MRGLGLFTAFALAASLGAAQAAPAGDAGSEPIIVAQAGGMGQGGMGQGGMGQGGMGQGGMGAGGMGGQGQMGGQGGMGMDQGGMGNQGAAPTRRMSRG